MLPLLTSAQIREADAATMAGESITSLELMERAAARCADRILHDTRAGRWGDAQQLRFVVFAGMGNNGGDGLVIARLLHGAGSNVRVIRVLHRVEPSPDHAANHGRALEQGIPVSDIQEGDAVEIHDNEVVIDAIFGSGLTGPVPVWVGQVIRSINRSGRPVISIDMPSGLLAEDNSATIKEHVVQASLTLTFEVPKLAFLLADNGPFVGEWSVLPIGLDHDFIHGLQTPYRMVQEKDAVRLLPPRPSQAHKGTFGHALIVAGGAGKMGAAVLATRAALRSGAGLVTSHAPRSGLSILQSSAPEAMCQIDRSEDHVTYLADTGKFDAVGIGPGLGTGDDTAQVIKLLIQSDQSRLVMDADALNILGTNPTWQAFLKPGSILTPHPREFDRLVGRTLGSSYDRLQAARKWATQHGCILILKGAHTAVCAPDGNVYFNPTGNPGMAKGGSGDALTGLLAGLLAQGMQPLQAALFGVYLHGSAGDQAAAHQGMDAMTVGDLIEALPQAWRNLRNASEEIG